MLLPTAQANDLQRALVDYLTTTFALADPEAQLALDDFLRHERHGIFKGPFTRLRLPSAPATDDWRTHLDWYPEGFTPYGHQASAYQRLTSKSLDGLRQPQPTLVTTGTGSGKTEAFLHPILDHVLRARRLGITGTKALILYPMNALATDQAQRLARLITTDPRLTGVTAALYTGDQGNTRTLVSEDRLINDRGVIRDSPPDILLTNYKMLDQLLLRPEDRPIWDKSRTSLAYLVLDEFHTYDGAQGTDVAMLLRRLGIVLGHATPGGGPPLGPVTPVATSATLGDRGDPAAMIDFATTVFGTTFDEDCVITETRLDVEQWQATWPPPEADPRTLTPRDLGDIPAGDSLLIDLWDDDAAPRSDDDRAARLAHHPQVARMIASAAQPRSLTELADAFFGSDAGDQGAEFVTSLLAALSLARAGVGNRFVSVETHLWIRELTRIDRVASAAVGYRWSDDGTTAPTDDTDDLESTTYPALYCRHCGRSGWGVTLEPTGTSLAVDSGSIRAKHTNHEPYFRALLFAPREAAEGHDRLHWLHVPRSQLVTTRPADNDPDYLDGRILPVLTHGRTEENAATHDHCPSCGRADGIRWLGSAIATLLSVSLGALFGTDQLEAGDKKALVFTDSVQDAAHRAGFVESRSHTLALRAAIRAAMPPHPINLTQLADAIIRDAGDDTFARYRLLAPEVVERIGFRRFWSEPTAGRVPNRITENVRRRLLFDLTLEFGLFSRFGRTLETTGSAVAEVDALAGALLNAGRRALDQVDLELPLGGTAPSDEQILWWVRGVLERMRGQGSIEHEWLKRYLLGDGNRYFIWGGRDKKRGMPAFPTGGSHPAFPRVGKPLQRARDMLLDQVTSTQAWYATWAGKVFGVPPGVGGTLSRLLLTNLTDHGTLNSTATDSGAQAYAIPTNLIVVQPTASADLEAGKHVLRCDICHGQHAGTTTVIDQLEGAPCLVDRCRGRLRRMAQQNNYYRNLYGSANMRRVVAREHSSILEDETRLAYETAFKASAVDPSAPNVLVATPTLEMGIDIGDLSTVMLASMPRSVANYLQRVGRAGRRTGNALNLAYVTGRRDALPSLEDPLSLINGRVRPPATFLSAEEILQRQYLAHIVDSFAADLERRHPHRARGALGSTEPGSFLGDLISHAETESTTLLTGFLGTFTTLSDEARDALTRWATPSDGPGTSGLAAQVYAASGRWIRTQEDIAYRITAIEARLPDLKQRAEMPAAADADKTDYRTADAALKFAYKQRGRINRQYWISGLEEQGLLPNYTLLDDSVLLDVVVTWIDPETDSWEQEYASITRPSARALKEFAPGATFYSRGYEIRIDAVELGGGGESIRTWAYCGECGYAQCLDERPELGACPRCGNSGITDTSQHLRVVELTRVSAQLQREEARISDSSDDRKYPQFTVVTAADFDPADAPDG